MTLHTRVPIALPMIVMKPIVKRDISQIESECQKVFAASGPSIRNIITATAAYFETDPWRLLQRRRLNKIVKPRQVAMAVTHSRGISSPEIGRRFGGFDHTTVINAIKRADRDAVAAICLLLDETRS